jgi:hypothetical protein
MTKPRPSLMPEKKKTRSYLLRQPKRRLTSSIPRSSLETSKKTRKCPKHLLEKKPVSTPHLHPHRVWPCDACHIQEQRRTVHRHPFLWRSKEDQDPPLASVSTRYRVPQTCNRKCAVQPGRPIAMEQVKGWMSLKRTRGRTRVREQVRRTSSPPPQRHSNPTMIPWRRYHSSKPRAPPVPNPSSPKKHTPSSTSNLWRRMGWAWEWIGRAGRVGRMRIRMRMRDFGEGSEGRERRRKER